MSNTSSDNFDAIAQDTMDLLIFVIGKLTADSEEARLLAKLVAASLAADICKRAIALGGV